MGYPCQIGQNGSAAAADQESADARLAGINGTVSRTQALDETFERQTPASPSFELETIGNFRNYGDSDNKSKT